MSLSSFLRFRGGHKHLPEEDVTEDVFVAMLMAEGKSRERAQIQANVCKEMNSRILVGEKMVGIKEKS